MSLAGQAVRPDRPARARGRTAEKLGLFRPGYAAVRHWRQEVPSGKLKALVAERANIVIAGGTSSGKTSFANALLAEGGFSGERIVILEDTRELTCPAANLVALRTQGACVSLRDLVRSTLRLRPDRIIVGEVRGAEALDLLKAWNTGHPGGLTTLHANSALGALSRLEQLVSEATARSPFELIAEAVDVIVFMSRAGGQRRVEDAVRVLEFTGEGYRTEPVLSRSDRAGPDGRRAA